MYTILNINIDQDVLEFPANDEVIKLTVSNHDNKNQSIKKDDGETLIDDEDSNDYVSSLIQLNHFIKKYYTFFNYAKLYDNAKQNSENTAIFKKVALDNKPRLADVDDSYIKNDLILDLFKQQSEKLK